MCDPITTTLMAVGTGVKAFGQKTQGDSEAQRLNFNAQVAEDNAKNAEYAAADAKSRGAREERKHRQKVKLLAGQQKAAYGASGVDVNVGAPADIVEETYLHGEDDAATIRYNAAMEAWGLKAKAADYRAQAGQYRAGAKSAKFSSQLGAGTTLLTGAATTAMSF